MPVLVPVTALSTVAARAVPEGTTVYPPVGYLVLPQDAKVLRVEVTRDVLTGDGAVFADLDVEITIDGGKSFAHVAGMGMTDDHPVDPKTGQVHTVSRLRVPLPVLPAGSGVRTTLQTKRPKTFGLMIGVE